MRPPRKGPIERQRMGKSCAAETSTRSASANAERQMDERVMGPRMLTDRANCNRSREGDRILFTFSHDFEFSAVIEITNTRIGSNAPHHSLLNKVFVVVV